VNFIQWLNRLFGGSQNGPAATWPNSSLPSKKSSTVAPSTQPKPSAAKRFPEAKVKTPNVSAKPIKPEAVVLHHSGGSYAGGVAWIKNRASRVSYHVLVAQHGRRTVFAGPTQRTWHAGKSEWRGKRDLNSWSIGAAFEGDTNKRQLGEAEMASMAEYLVPLMKQYGIPLNNVTDHRTVSPGRKDDLAKEELARFKAYLAARIAVLV
jgi:N-acetyl-anhydromuramyl-L-alanine amidase AmpD